MTKDSDFSVVIPLYNKVQFIHQALESVLRQDLAPREILVVDDGSTDGGAEVVRSRFPTVTLIQQANRGVGAARNNGIASARSPWVALLDADDVWAPEHLRELQELVGLYPDAGLVSTARAEFAGTKVPSLGFDGHPDRREIDYFREAARHSSVVWSSATAVRVAAFDDVGGFGPWPVGEDIELWCRIALRYRVAVSDARTAGYRRGVGGVMDTVVAAEDRSVTPMSVRDLGYSAATVADALATGAARVPKHSLMRYLDGRVAGKMRSAFARGEYQRMRELRSLLSSRGLMMAAAPTIISFLPDRVLERIRKTQLD